MSGNSGRSDDSGRGRSEIDRRSLLAGGLGWATAAVAGGIPAAAAEGKRRIKVAQFGVGHAHASKLSVYRASSDYEVVAIVEPDEGLRKRAESQPVFRDLPWMSLEQILNRHDVEVVLVETQVRDLLDVAEKCVAAGKHIHLDKPAGESLPQYRRLLESAKKQETMVQMGYMYRYNPAVILLREMLKQGWLGTPFEVHTVMSKVVDPASRRSLAEYPGGILFELGCHIIDLVVGVLGRPDAVQAFPRQVTRKADSLFDNMLAVLQYPTALATVKSSALEVDGGERRHFTLCGTSGTFHIQPLDNPSVRLTLSEKRGEYRKGTHEVKMPTFVRYVADAADMAQVIRGEKACDFSYEHDLAVQETVLKACNLPGG